MRPGRTSSEMAMPDLVLGLHMLVDAQSELPAM
jgi:hypothetical protein